MKKLADGYHWADVFVTDNEDRKIAAKVIRGPGGSCRFEKPIGDECWVEVYPRYVTSIMKRRTEPEQYVRIDRPGGNSNIVTARGENPGHSEAEIDAAIAAGTRRELTRVEAEAIVPPKAEPAPEPDAELTFQVGDWVVCSGGRVTNPCVIITPAEFESQRGFAACELYCFLDAAGLAWQTTGSDITLRLPQIGERVWVDGEDNIDRHYRGVGVIKDVHPAWPQLDGRYFVKPENGGATWRALSTFRPVEFAPKPTLREQALAMVHKASPDSPEAIVDLIVEFCERL